MTETGVLVHPIQKSRLMLRDRTYAPQVVTMRAYEVYVHLHGEQEALVTGECRGGFGVGETRRFPLRPVFPEGRVARAGAGSAAGDATVMPRALVLSAAVLLAGCAGAPRVEVQQVNVAVPVECQEPVPVRPAMPTEGLERGASVDDFARAAMAEIERREGYEGQLRSALLNCTATLSD